MIQRSLVTSLLVVLFGTATWAAGYTSSEPTSPAADATATASATTGTPTTAKADASAAKTDPSRQTIREMPLLERPNRPGHFYGNTVRRVHNFRTARGS